MKLTPQNIKAHPVPTIGTSTRGARNQWKRILCLELLLVLVFTSIVSQLAKARSNAEKTSDRDRVEQHARHENSKPGDRSSHVTTSLPIAFGGNDDCPARKIPPGTYTASAPYTDSGDTTGANDTVTGLIYDFWDFTPTRGLDQVYSFTLTSKGANPEIRVSGLTGSPAPFMFILEHRTDGCPAGTRNYAYYALAESWIDLTPGTTVINGYWMDILPLNAQLYLFIDSETPGPYTLKMQDVTIAASNANPIDSQQFFVRQHYLDFLNREPEPDGFVSWLRFLNNCAPGDQACSHEHRLTTSGGFFGSTEFHIKGYFAFRFYRVAFDRLPEFSEIAPDMQSVSGLTPNDVYTRKAAFTDSFAQRPEFEVFYGGKSNSEYVDTLLSRYALASITTTDPAQPDGAVKITLSRAQLVSRLDTSSLTRAQVLRAIADSNEIFNQEYNGAFVAMQYYGYLRRTPEPEGYNDWLDYLNRHPGAFREMVRGFVDSTEYRMRFAQP